MHLVFLTAARPSIVPLVMTNPMATTDRRVGTLLVANPGTRNVKVTVAVNSDPCPSVEWTFAGSPIPQRANANPCRGVSPFTFTLTIGILRTNNSGKYSAIFNNSFGGVIQLPSLVISIPGKTSNKVESLHGSSKIL